MQVNTPYMDALGMIKVGVILSHHEPHSLAQEFCWPAGKSHFSGRIIGYRKSVCSNTNRLGQTGGDILVSRRVSELNPFFCHE